MFKLLHIQALAYRDLVVRAGPDGLEPRYAEIVAGWARSLTGADGASVTVVDGEYAEYVAATGVISGVFGRRIVLDDCFTGMVLRGSVPRLFRPEQAPPSSRSRAARDAIRVGIVAPILRDGEAVGTIGIASPDDARFDENTVVVMGDLARFVGALLARTSIP